VSTAREEILDRIRAAISPDTPGRAGTPAEVDAAYAALPRDYRRAHHDVAGSDIVALFAERAADYRAVVERVPEADLPAAIARVLADVPRFLVPDGLPPQWLARLPADGPVEASAGDEAGRPAADRVVLDDPPLSARELDTVTGVITGCAAAIAETGTIILDHGPGQGRRALTLVPDFHLVVVRADQVAADLPDAIARLDPARPHTLISGPSATSDIELIRVEGVHGPRNLHILIAGLPDAVGGFPIQAISANEPGVGADGPEQQSDGRDQEQRAPREQPPRKRLVRVAAVLERIDRLPHGVKHDRSDRHRPQRLNRDRGHGRPGSASPQQDRSEDDGQAEEGEDQREGDERPDDRSGPSAREAVPSVRDDRPRQEQQAQALQAQEHAHVDKECRSQYVPHQAIVAQLRHEGAAVAVLDSCRVREPPGSVRLVTIQFRVRMSPLTPLWPEPRLQA
jgi:L-lactate dehydrogenase complex protein LldG